MFKGVHFQNEKCDCIKYLKLVDPCCGSGHILAYMFDVLMKIYESYGYTTREAVASIVENNLYGLDIDERAAQLAYFAIMMKARQYDRRFFSRGIQPYVYAIVESNHVDQFAVDYFCNGDAKLKAAMGTILSDLHDAKEYGSILTVTPQDWSALYDRFVEITEDINMSRETALRELLPLVQVAEALAQKYDSVVTNPPYMGSSGMSAKLSDFVKKNYPDSKSDLFAVFIEKCGQMVKRNGYQAMITQHAWMFLSSFEKLRTKLLQTDIVNMAHLGARAFEEIGGEVVQTTSFVLRKNHIADYESEYCRLIEPTTQQGKEDMFLDGKNRYVADQSNFPKIPGSPVAYWVTDEVYECFDKGLLGQYATTKQGFKTGDNNRFLRLWYEADISKTSFNGELTKKWFPCTKGGEYRKWYGNFEYIVNWENDGFEIKHFVDDKGKLRSRPQNLQVNFTKEITWSSISSANISFRLADETFMYESKGPVLTPKINYFLMLAYLNSKVYQQFIKIVAPTLDYSEGAVLRVPYINVTETKESGLADFCVNLSKNDWDSFETSWDFRKHPLIRKVSTIAEAFDQWQAECDNRFNQLKANEEELNRIFIDIYGLQDELTPEVEDKDVTVRKADLGRDVRSFISYAVGCMFGRYSLDEPGLILAGQRFSEHFYEASAPLAGTGRAGAPGSYMPVGEFYYKKENGIAKCTYSPDKDNIIPICDDEYFEDDIVGRFVGFVKTVYGEDTLDENLKFIADALGGKGQPKDVIRNYFLNDFYKDHCKIYQKRPIYWLFDSGKKNGFKALIYMHRYQPDTIARIRTDYVHEQQSRYRTAMADLEKRIDNATAGERVKLNKELNKLQAQAEEIRIYEEKIHHLADQMIRIDLDDGVKHNYAIFKDVLAKIK